jgi:hypothetical protein
MDRVPVKTTVILILRINREVRLNQTGGVVWVLSTVLKVPEITFLWIPIKTTVFRVRNQQSGEHTQLKKALNRCFDTETAWEAVQTTPSRQVQDSTEKKPTERCPATAKSPVLALHIIQARGRRKPTGPLFALVQCRIA